MTTRQKRHFLLFLLLLLCLLFMWPFAAWLVGQSVKTPLSATVRSFDDPSISILEWVNKDSNLTLTCWYLLDRVTVNHCVLSTQRRCTSKDNSCDPPPLPTNSLDAAVNILLREARREQNEPGIKHKITDPPSNWWVGESEYSAVPAHPAKPSTDEQCVIHWKIGTMLPPRVQMRVYSVKHRPCQVMQGDKPMALPESCRRAYHRQKRLRK